MKQFQIVDINNVTHAVEASDMRSALMVYEQILAPQLDSGEPVKVEWVH